MDGHQATSGIINFLRESQSAFVCIDFLDVAGNPTCASSELANISSAATR
jgi:hypothetical protein